MPCTFTVFANLSCRRNPSPCMTMSPRSFGFNANDRINMQHQERTVKETLARKKDLSPPHRLAGAGSGSLHEWPLLRKQQVVLSLIHKVPAHFIAFDKQVRAHSPHQELWAQKGQTHMLQHLHVHIEIYTEERGNRKPPLLALIDLLFHSLIYIYSLLLYVYRRLIFVGLVSLH